MDQDKKYSIPQNLAYCIKAAAQTCPALIWFCAGVIVCNTLVPLITAYLPKAVIEQISAGQSIGRLLAVTAVFAVSLAAAEALQKYFDRLIYWHKFKMNTHFLRMITRKGLTTDYRNQENDHFRKLQDESFASCNGNFSYFAQTYDAAVLFFSSLLGLGAFLGILISLSPWILLFLVAATFAGYFWNRRLVKWVEKNTEEKASYEQYLHYVIRISDDIQAAKDIRLYRMALWFDRIYKEKLSGLLIWYRRYTARLFGVSAADSMLSLIREGAAYLFLLYMALKGKISAAQFVLYFNVIAGFSTWLSGLLGQIGRAQMLNVSVNRFRSYLEYPEHYRRSGGVPIGAFENPGTIELKNVSFRYGEDGDFVLKDINLTLRPGEHLAVVGLNGAGKTTLVKLICGLIEPTEGEVLYEGVDIRCYDRDAYYRLFGAVFQDHSILPVTIAEIVAEDLGENVDEEKAARCLAEAGLLEKIESLPGGLHSRFDRSFWDDGVNLSGGELQKLMLARALYRDSPLILLDEPTAALDPLSENRLYETYDEMMAGKSTVFISHRLASTRFCSRIILMEQGRLTEEGTHETLLALGGRYRSLFDTQAKYYRENPVGEEGEHEAE